MAEREWSEIQSTAKKKLAADKPRRETRAGRERKLPGSELDQLGFSLPRSSCTPWRTAGWK
jgi:hypothetical protein